MKVTFRPQLLLQTVWWSKSGSWELQLMCRHFSSSWFPLPTITWPLLKNYIVHSGVSTAPNLVIRTVTPTEEQPTTGVINSTNNSNGGVPAAPPDPVISIVTATEETPTYPVTDCDRKANQTDLQCECLPTLLASNCVDFVFSQRDDVDHKVHFLLFLFQIYSNIFCALFSSHESTLHFWLGFFFQQPSAVWLQHATGSTLNFLILQLQFFCFLTFMHFFPPFSTRISDDFTIFYIKIK